MQDPLLPVVVGAILALAGIFVSVELFFYGNIMRSMEALKDEQRPLRQSVERIAGGPTAFFPHLFLTALAREARFWEKLSIQRADKILIASAIASDYIQENDIVIIDSGTTVDQIPHILLEKHLRSKVYTNNVLAAISVVPPAEGVDCFLLQGRVDPIYGATYNMENIAAPLRPLGASQIVLAATAISFDQGPLVNHLDSPNQRFKKELVQKALHDGGNPRLIIAVDWTKFSQELDHSAAREFVAVLEPQTWRIVRSTSRFVLVTTQPLDSLKTPAAIKARGELRKFLESMRKGGMNVAIC